MMWFLPSILVFVFVYSCGRQDHPGEYKTPIVKAIKPAMIVSIIMLGVFLT